MWELEDAYGARYVLPASITINQLHVGGRPRARLVRGYGSNDWYRTQDGIREPNTIDLIGWLSTDRDDAGAQNLIDDLVNAAADAVLLVLTHAGSDVRALELLGSLPITTSPDGIDGSLVRVTLPLIPAGEWDGGDYA